MVLKKSRKSRKSRKNIEEGIFVKDDITMNRSDYNEVSDEEGLINEELKDKQIEEEITSGNEETQSIDSEYSDDENNKSKIDDDIDSEEIYKDNSIKKKNDNCLYNFINIDKDKDEYDDENEMFDEESEIDTETDITEKDNQKDDDIMKKIKKTHVIVDNSERETKPILTKYERVRILGDRAKQLSLGAKPMLLNVEHYGPKDIARLELEKGVIPFIIERPLPDGRYERWKVSELKIVN